MKFLKNILFISIVILSFFSCEEVIVLDLNTVPQQLVIEGFVTDKEGPYTVKISKTVDFYDPNTFPLQENAIVKISDDQGNEETLVETTSGIYKTNILQGKRGITYTMDVTVENKMYSAKSKMAENLIPLDSLVVEFREESFFEKEGYYTTAFFNDPPEIENYYRMQVFVNGEVYVFTDENEENSAEDINFWLLSDEFTDGNVQEIEFPHTLEKSDTMEVILHSINKETFDYYRTLVDVINGGGIAPSNPISNINNDALGYFGAFSVTSNFILVED